jgi:hypothetical protein
MNWFTDQMQKFGILKAPLPAVEMAPVVEQPAPPPPFDLDAIMKRVRECKRDQYVVLCGKLFMYVDDRTTHYSPFDGRGKPIPLLTYMPENFHVHMDYMPVEPEFYPKSPEDIQRPDDWIEWIDQCETHYGRMRDLVEQMDWAFRLISKDDPLLFVKSRGWHVPVIKLYTDLSWIDAGWEGPAIAVGCQGDRRYPVAMGLIPDDTKLHSLKEVVDEFTKFRDGPLQEMFTNHESVIKFNDTYDSFIKYLDEKSINYR